MKKIIIITMLTSIILSSLQSNAQNDLYEMDLESLMNIEIVSASKKAEDIFEAPLGATVLKSEQIKESGATSIMEALRLVPGVIVRETTPGNYDIHLRGYDGVDPKGIINLTTNTTTLIMINNRPVYSEFQGQTYWELLQIGINDVEQIEVVRGPVSAMYGPNAVTGVINILTKSPNTEKPFGVSTHTMAGYPNSIISSTAISYNTGSGLSMRLSGNADIRDRHNVDYYVYNNGTDQGAFIDEPDNSLLNIIGLPVADPDQPYIIDPTSGLPMLNLNSEQRYPNPNMAINKLAGNLHLNYTKNDFDVNLTGGYASAEVQRVYANNNVTALTHDSLDNLYSHLWGSYKGLNFSADYSQGSNSIIGSGEVLSVDYNLLSGSADYDLIISENFSLKPGISYKTTRYNSMGLGSTQQVINPTTFFTEGYEIVTPDDGGDIENSVISGHIQADYKWKALRLLGAARIDKFQYPDLAVISPLFSATYKITDDFLVRGSYGRSSRTPFMFDLFMDINLRYPAGGGLYNNLVYRGTERADEIPNSNDSRDYKLLTIDDGEIGFRHNISETFTLDIELFWSQLSNLVTLNPVLRDTIDGVDPLTGVSTREAIEYYSYVNLKTKPQQTGATLSNTSIPFKKMSFQIFVTVQQTKINDYPDAVNANGDEMDTDGDGETHSDFYHTATPAFTGGVNMNYRPMKKLNINVNSYFYGHQTLTINNEMNTENVDANILLNASVHYQIMEGLKLFVTGRNLVGGEKRQYAFADKIGASVLGGISVNF
ncbi:MAG: TonB-dependent receptor [Salinivirgaceae bacterium]|jgi:iron complex outermembrane receptor protein|nr:TonB-dependent receptor [Salinivirgaceae bacterium]